MLLGEVFHTTGNDARHRFVAIAHQYFFTVTNHLDVSTKPSFQVTDVNGFHIAIIADVTMLVILTPCLLHRIGTGTPVTNRHLSSSREMTMKCDSRNAVALIAGLALYQLMVPKIEHLTRAKYSD